MGAKPRLRPPGKSAAAQAAADNAANAIYAWQGTFDRIKLREGFIREFGKSAHYDAAAIPQMELLVGFIEADTRITDVRWTAYMRFLDWKVARPGKASGNRRIRPANGNHRQHRFYRERQPSWISATDRPVAPLAVARRPGWPTAPIT